jgi:hypothetical protein
VVVSPASFRRAGRLFAVCLTLALAGGGAAVSWWSDPAAAQERPPAGLSGRTVALDDLAISGRRIASDENGMVQVLLADGTTFTLAAGSEIVIDSYAFDPSAGTAEVAASVTRGVVRFLGNRTTADGVRIETPFGALLVDRAMADIDLGEAGGPAHFDMIFGKGMRLVRGASTIANVYEPGYSIVPAADGRSARVRKTPAEWTSAIQQRLATPRG